MLFAYGGFGLILLVVWVYCLLEAITSDAAAVRNLPKPLWVLVVLLLPDVGSILWLLAGRPRAGAATRPGGLPYKGNTGRPGVPWPSGPTAGFPEYERPGAPPPPAGPDDDPAFQERLRRRVEEQRRRARDEGDGAVG